MSGQRRYAVTDVIGSTLPSSPLRLTDRAVQHLVSLAAVEDDAFGEELQAIWELEPGTRIHETVALPTPTGFDDPGRLDAFLDAVRWGAASTADMRSIQAPFRSGIDYVPMLFACWHRTSSTSSFSPPHPITATRKVLPLCSNCSIASALPVALNPTASSSRRLWCAA
jgi:hypothetical protein